jgi:helix-turn-helix protein
LGIPIGSPINGELRITVDEKMINVDEWINNVFKKDIKKQIKSLPNTNRIKKMVFTPSKNDMSTLKFYFQDFTSYEMKREIRQKVVDLLDSLGYEKIRVEIPH